MSDSRPRPVAVYPRGHKVELHATGLNVLSPSGRIVGSFNGRGLNRADIEKDGSISVHRVVLSSSTVRDASLPLSTQLARINQANQDFCARLYSGEPFTEIEKEQL